jgi:hypothetical protein
MASIAQRTSEDPITEEDPGYEMVLEISTETRLLLSRLAAESGGSEFDVIGKAVALYQVALDASREGKKIVIYSDDFELEREIVGF